MVKVNNNTVAGSPLSGGGDSNGAMNNKIKVYLSDYKITLEMSEQEFATYLTTLVNNLRNCMCEHYRLCNNAFSCDAANALTVNTFLSNVQSSPIRLGIRGYNDEITNTKGYKFSISTLLFNLCSENSPLLFRVIHYSGDLESMVEKAAATLMAHGE